MSTRSDRSDAVQLDGARTTGAVSVFLTVTGTPASVVFQLDNQNPRIERRAPFDLLGTLPKRTDAQQLAAPRSGKVKHTVTATVTWSGSSTRQLVSATFTQSASAEAVTAPPSTLGGKGTKTSTPKPSAFPTVASPSSKRPTSKAPASPLSTPKASATNSHAPSNGSHIVPVTVEAGCPSSGTHTAHVIIDTAGVRCDVSGDTFEDGLEVGAFRWSGPGVTVVGSGVTIHNPSGSPGQPDARGLAVLPGATVTLSDTTISHTLSDGIGVLGGTLTLSGSQQWDAYGSASTDHVDGLQETSGTVTLSDDTFGLSPSGSADGQGNVLIKGDAGAASGYLSNVTIGGYGGRIGLDFNVGAAAKATGAYSDVTFVTAGSSGSDVRVAPGCDVDAN